MTSVGAAEAPKRALTGASLGTTDDLLTPPLSDRGCDRVKRQTSRISVWAMKAAQRQFTDAVSSRFCGYPRGGTVPVTVSRDLVAHVGGIQRCGSLWACPPCARAVRRKRAEDINAGLSFHLAAGGGALLWTATLPHQVGDALAERLGVVGGALGSCLQGAGWNRHRARMAYAGSIRSVEITYGDEHGWHPHVHALLLFSRPIGAAEAADFGRWLYGRWNGLCEGRGLGTVNRDRGVDLRVVDQVDGVDAYLAKADERWHVGQELARGDLKLARQGGATPFELLGRFMQTGEVRWLMLWREFEAATFGRVAIFWSHGLRVRLLGEELEISDQEAAAAEGLSDDVLVVAIEDGERWWKLVKAGTAGHRLQEIEEVAAVFMFMLMWSGGRNGKQTSSQSPSQDDSGRAGRSARRAEAGPLRR